jgi:hypothetical protein
MRNERSRVVWQLMAAIAAFGGCSDQPATTQAGASGRAVFENAADATDATGLGAEAADFDTFVVDGAGVEGATAGSASERRWPKNARTSPNAGSVTGQVYDAATGRAIAAGTVSTAAACTGKSCGPGVRSRTSRPTTTVNLRNGAFTFDAATRQLTLAANTTFRVSVPGYVSVRVAHGPSGAVSSGGQLVTPLPPIYLCRIGATNSDRDGICDAAEARYGTDPRQVDSDGDALSDAAELYGVWDREVLDIRGLGADPRRTDVLLEVDFMSGRKPSDDVVNAVVAAFDQAPPNPNFPNNKPGIGLHAWIDDQVDSSPDIDWPNYLNAKPIIQNWFNLGSRWPTHYGLFANRLIDMEMGGVEDPASGISMGIAGTVFFITLHEVTQDGETYVPTEEDKASTLMHELGHNLGLFHGGDEDSNYKPNYFSVMNYLYQFRGVPLDPEDFTQWSNWLDYSRIGTSDLLESALNEQEGIPPSYRAGSYPISLVNPRYCRCFDQKENCIEGTIKGNVPGQLDFNRDGVINEMPVAADLTGNLAASDAIRGVRMDWENLVFHGKNIQPVTARIAATDVNRPCPGPQPVRSQTRERFAADGGVGMVDECGATTIGRFAADGGMEDASIVDDAAIPDAASLEDAAIGIDVPITDAGVVTGSTEGIGSTEGVGSTDAGTPTDDLTQTDAASGVDEEANSADSADSTMTAMPDAGAWWEEPDPQGGASGSGASDGNESEGSGAEDPWAWWMGQDPAEDPVPPEPAQEPMQADEPIPPEDAGVWQDPGQ